MVKCPGCGETNDVGYRFCRNCGHSLPTTEDRIETPPPSPAAPAPGTVSEEAAAQVLTKPILSYKLVATAGLLAGRNFTIGPGGLMIGRDPANCQVVVADDEVSRLHAWIGFNDEGELTIRDRHSANGTFINRVRVQEKALQPDDEISIGSGHRHVFRVERVPNPTSGDTPAGPDLPQQAASGRRGTSVLEPAEQSPSPPEEKGGRGTVVLKLTKWVGRPHVELIVDKYAVRALDIPECGLVVGRDPNCCQLLIEHPSVSGRHAEFGLKEGKAFLSDHSTNGTFVNGRRVATVELQDGDYITFGRYAGKSLIFRTGSEPELKTKKIDLTKDRVTVGRDPLNDVVIDHPVVSKKHAEIIKKGGEVRIVDLGSTNGTFVNGIRVKRHQLQEFDRIVIGPLELHFSGASLSHPAETSVVRLDVRALSFEVTDRNTGKPKLLLEGISLVVKPRELIGLLGPSGAGKSTLISVLNGLAKPSSGQVLYNGADLYQNLRSLKSTIGYVPQEDIMHRQLTVRQCLYYAAKLRLPEDLSEEEIHRRVEEMLDSLKIEAQQWDNPVATLSGGQRKRVSLGIELLSKPGVLFLDEPTAGLDPRTETLMMMLFRQLANQGSTIVMTTHMLGSFGILDKVLVMLQGRTAYFGPGSKFLEYFKAESPPDVYDDLTDNNNASYALELKQRFLKSPLYSELVAEPLKGVTSETETGPAGPAPEPAEEERGFSLHQLKVLIGRNWALKFSERVQTALLFLQAPVVALLIGLMASDQNQVQTLFMAMFAALWFGCSNAVREIVDEQSIYRHERQTGLKIPSYIFSKLAALSLIALVQCACIVLVLLNVNRALSLSPGEVGVAIGVLFLVAVNGTLIGLVISSLVSTPEKALALFPLALMPELLLSGIFLPVNRIQPVIPITVEQLFEGNLFAQPEAKRKAESLMAPAAAPGVNSPSSPEPASPASKKLRTGSFAHQVVGALAPAPQAERAFQRYTAQPIAGMPGPVRWLSALAVSRWGTEALADLCLHGQHSTEDSAYKIVNTVFISLHPGDQQRLLEGLETPPGDLAAASRFPLPSDFWLDQGPYLAILAGFALAMTATVLILMKRKDVT